jgi:hypothetical protein
MHLMLANESNSTREHGSVMSVPVALKTLSFDRSRQLPGYRHEEVEKHRDAAADDASWT